MIIDEVYLEHFGVKGMRWGVRNDEEREERRSKIKRGVKTAAKVGLTVGATSSVLIGAAFVKRRYNLNPNRTFANNMSRYEYKRSIQVGKEFVDAAKRRQSFMNVINTTATLGG